MHYNDRCSTTIRGANISIPYEMLLPVWLLLLTFFISVIFFILLTLLLFLFELQNDYISVHLLLHLLVLEVFFIIIIIFDH